LGFTLLTGCGATTRSSATDSDSTDSTSSSGGNSGSGDLRHVPAAWLACSQPSDCTVTFAGCCSCGEASVDTSIAIARSSVDAYRADACGDASVCTACISIANPYLQAGCIEGSCTLVDVDTPPYVSCSESSDCMLRTATCCACDQSASRIAIAAASEAAFSDLICDENPICPDCAGVPAVTDLDALCHEGRCIVRGFEL